MKFKYILVHEHAEGTTTYQFSSPQPFIVPGEGALTKLAEILGINFEPHKQEFLNLEEYNDDFTILTPEQYKQITDADKEWTEDSPHGEDCAIRLHPSAECTCGKADWLADHQS